MPDYQINTNRHLFNMAPWLCEKSYRMLKALGYMIDAYRQSEPLVLKQGTSLPEDSMFSSPTEGFEEGLDEALHMAFSLFFFGLGEVDGYSLCQSDLKNMFEHGTKGLDQMLMRDDVVVGG